MLGKGISPNQAVDIINMDNPANPLEYLDTLDCINLGGSWE